MAARPQKARSGDSKTVVRLFSVAWSDEYAVLVGSNIRRANLTDSRKSGRTKLPAQTRRPNNGRAPFVTSAQWPAPETVFRYSTDPFSFGPQNATRVPCTLPLSTC